MTLAAVLLLSLTAMVLGALYDVLRRRYALDGHFLDLAPALAALVCIVGCMFALFAAWVVTVIAVVDWLR